MKFLDLEKVRNIDVKITPNIRVPQGDSVEFQLIAKKEFPFMDVTIINRKEIELSDELRTTRREVQTFKSDIDGDMFEKENLLWLFRIHPELTIGDYKITFFGRDDEGNLETERVAWLTMTHN